MNDIAKDKTVDLRDSDTSV